jgi:hypothetical protein
MCDTIRVMKNTWLGRLIEKEGVEQALEKWREKNRVFYDGQPPLTQEQLDEIRKGQALEVIKGGTIRV